MYHCNKLITCFGLILFFLLITTISTAKNQSGRTDKKSKDTYSWKKDYQKNIITATPIETPQSVNSKKNDLFYKRYFRKGVKSAGPEELQRQKYQKELDALKRYQRLKPQGTPTPVLTEQEKEIRKLIGLLGTDQKQRASAIRRLTIIGDPAIPALRKALYKKDKVVKVGALSALKHIFAENAVKDIQRLLKDKEPDVRIEAATTLGRFRHTPSAKLVILLLNDPKKRVRKAAVNALGRMKRSSDAEIALIKAMESNTYLSIKKEAAQALAVFSSQEVVESLLRATYEKDNELVAYVIRSLGDIADPISKIRIQSFKTHKNAFIANEATNALENFK